MICILSDEIINSATLLFMYKSEHQVAGTGIWPFRAHPLPPSCGDLASGRASNTQDRQGCHCVLGERGRQALGTLRLEYPRAQGSGIILACLTLRSPKNREWTQASESEPSS